MTTVTALGALCPRLHPDILLGPGLTDGAGVTHHLKDPRTGWFFRVGVREYFVISRLDGARTLDEIAAAYLAEFGRRLSDDHFQQIMAMLGTRRLLAGGEDEEDALRRLADSARSRSRGRRNLLYWRIPLTAPTAFFRAVEPRLRWLYSRWFVVAALLAVLGLLTLIATQAPALYADGQRLIDHPPVLVTFIVLFWVGLALHEAAHGLTCIHFGGTAPEIGLLWRFPLLAPYCKADDVVLFARRRHRVYTAFAGVFAHLLMLVPFALLWLVLPDGPARVLPAALVLFGAGSAIVNLLPFLQLDGYFMLNHSLNMMNLRQGSYRFWGDAARRLTGRGRPGAAYPHRVGWAYGLYGAASFVFATVLLIGLVVVWYGQLRGPLGQPLAGVAIATGLIVLAVAAFVFARRRAS